MSRKRGPYLQYLQSNGDEAMIPRQTAWNKAKKVHMYLLSVMKFDRNNVYRPPITMSYIKFFQKRSHPVSESTSIPSDGNVSLIMNGSGHCDTEKMPNSFGDISDVDRMEPIVSEDFSISEPNNDTMEPDACKSFINDGIYVQDEFEDIDNFRKVHKDLNCTVKDAMNMIYAYSVRHNLNWVAVENLVRLINAITDTNVLIPSKYIFKKTFEKKDLISPVVHFWCQKCEKYLGTKESLANSNVCESCDTVISKDIKYKKNHFISIPMRIHLKNALERNSEFLKFNESPIHGNMTDVHDAENFRNLKRDMGNESYITLSVYTDGASVFKATKDKSFWPINIFINEIDLEYRFQRKNILCTAISFGKTPNMQIFFKPFIKEIKAINEEGGIEFQNKHGEKMNVKVIPMIFTADALAKAYVLNIVQHNGHCGCPYCLHRGTIIDGSTHIKYCNKDNAEIRTDFSSRSNMIEAHSNETTVNGYYGISPLVAIGKNFDIVWQSVIDKMHCVDMGVVKKMYDLFLHTKNRSERYHNR